MVKSKESIKPDRLSVTLGSGQRKALEAFADRNDASLAFVIRYALNLFIEEHGQRQLRLEFKDFSDSEKL